MALLDKKTSKKEPDLVNVDEIIAEIQVPKEYKDIYEKFILAGLNFMFGKNTHRYFIEQAKLEGPLVNKITDGVVNLTLFLIMRFNGAIPPFIVIPAAIVFTCKSFEFLERTQYPEATKQTLGTAITKVIEAFLQKAGHKIEDIPKLIEFYMQKVNEGMKDA